MRRTAISLLATTVLLGSVRCPSVAADYTGDGRLPQTALLETLEAGLGPGWRSDTVYAYPDESAQAIRAWRTERSGPALWIIAGVHGEESAGPNAIARNASLIAEINDAGIPVVLIPLANPKAYFNNWRYPNTPERDWKKGGGYSVGDSEYLLMTGKQPRAAKAPGPETTALTRFVLDMAKTYPPALVLDLHEDELSVDGGYIYSQGIQAEDNPVGAEIVRALQSAGIRLRMGGHTRFGEPIVDGVISRDDKGSPIRDGSIDELLAADTVFIDGMARKGPSAETVIVVETPADASVSFEQRVAGQGEVLKRLWTLWQLNQAISH
jgi:hypothetical protein